MYEIPKISVPVVILMIDEKSIAGHVFLSENQVSASGNPLIEDFLNDSMKLFFPFQSDTGEHRLINKKQVAFIKTEVNSREIRELTPLRPRSLVAHFTNDRAVKGTVYPTIAEESRVSDLINHSEDFIAVYQEGRKTILNREHIIYINTN